MPPQNTPTLRLLYDICEPKNTLSLSLGLELFSPVQSRQTLSAGGGVHNLENFVPWIFSWIPKIFGQEATAVTQYHRRGPEPCRSARSTHPAPRAKANDHHTACTYTQPHSLLRVSRRARQVPRSWSDRRLQLSDTRQANTWWSGNRGALQDHAASVLRCNDRRMRSSGTRHVAPRRGFALTTLPSALFLSPDHSPSPSSRQPL